MMEPRVTIMIPTYNQAAYLECAVESALAQDYANLEIIIADDCSYDETPKIAQKFKKNSRLKYHRNNTNSGKTANYRRCLYDLASGEWTLNLDGDDYLTDNHYISFAMEQIKRHENVVLFTAGVIELPEKKCAIHHTHRLVEAQVCLEGMNLFLNWHSYKIPHLTTLYNRQKACSVGFYKEEISSTDWESLLRLALHGKVILSERIVGVWRKHEANLSQSLTCAQFIDNFTLITGPYKYALNAGEDRALLDKWKQNMMRYVMRGQFDAAWSKTLQAKNWPEIRQFVRLIGKEMPGFVKHFFQVKNIGRFCYYCAANILGGLGQMVKNIVVRIFATQNKNG